LNSFNKYSNAQAAYSESSQKEEERKEALLDEAVLLTNDNLLGPRYPFEKLPFFVKERTVRCTLKKNTSRI
jgi:hypothetical protein